MDRSVLIVLIVMFPILIRVNDACCCVKNNACWKFTCCGCYNDPNDEQDCSYTCGETIESCKRYKDVCTSDSENGAIWMRKYCDKNEMKAQCNNGWYEINTSQELRDGLYGPGDLSPSTTCSEDECSDNLERQHHVNIQA
eukprot:111381_1